MPWNLGRSCFLRRTELRWKLNTSFAPPLCFRYGSA